MPLETSTEKRTSGNGGNLLNWILGVMVAAIGGMYVDLRASNATTQKMLDETRNELRECIETNKDCWNGRAERAEASTDWLRDYKLKNDTDEKPRD